MALSPQADLATEPRWFRGNATFGDRAATVSPMVQAFIEGYQGGPNGVQPGGVATVVKHWAGYGAQVAGLDSHNPYGKYMQLDNASLDQHFSAFEGAFAVKSAGVMPAYSIPVSGLTVNGEPVEPVSVGFSRQLLEDSLRGRFGFEGFVMSDWLITADCPIECREGTFDVNLLGMPWGVEHLSVDERFAKGINAGIDQFGGVMDTEVIVRLVDQGLVSQERVDLAATRILEPMVRLGLFENAYVDVALSPSQVGTPEALALGLGAQHRSMVLLKNTQDLLPLDPQATPRAWLHGVEAEAARAAGFVPVDTLAQADIALVRGEAPYSTHPDYFFGSSAHEGPLTLGPGNPDYEAVMEAWRAGVPVVADIYADRPPVLTLVEPYVAAMFVDYGVTDQAFLDIVTGSARPEGRLPVELPSSDAQVVAQQPDLPSDTTDPLYESGFGMSYAR